MRCWYDYYGEDQVAARVLLVEDEGLICMVTAHYLEAEGFTVVEACDGDEAVRLLDGSGPFDVLFTDVQMPGKMDGLAVATHAQAGRNRHLRPVVIAT